MKYFVILLMLLFAAEPALAHKKHYEYEYCKEYKRYKCKEHRRHRDHDRHYDRRYHEKETCVKIVRKNITFVLCEDDYRRN